MAQMSPATIWMGDLEPYMDELFVVTAFQQMGVQVKNVKMIHKDSSAATYCFVELADANTAQRTMLSLSNKVVPMTNPPVRFKLNHASYGREHLTVPEYSLWVGELSDDVDDLALYDAFAKRYSSVRHAKIVVDSKGRSKGFGFVRFTDEEDRTRSLTDMQHASGVGHKHIRVSIATPRSQKREYLTWQTTNRPGSDAYSAYYNQPYQQWQQQYPGYQATSSHYGYQAGGDGSYYSNADYNQSQSESYNPYARTTLEDDEELVDPNEEIDIKEQNRLFMERSEELYTALEHSKWIPVDNLNRKLTLEMLS